MSPSRPTTSSGGGPTLWPNSLWWAQLDRKRPRRNERARDSSRSLGLGQRAEPSDNIPDCVTQNGLRTTNETHYHHHHHHHRERRRKCVSVWPRRHVTFDICLPGRLERATNSLEARRLLAQWLFGARQLASAFRIPLGPPLGSLFPFC